MPVNPAIDYCERRTMPFGVAEVRFRCHTSSCPMLRSLNSGLWIRRPHAHGDGYRSGFSLSDIGLATHEGP